MPLDSNSSKNENILPLLRAYRVSSSENLQEQIVEIYMGLIRETIATLPISLINQTRIGNQRSRDRPVTSERRVSNRRTAERRLSDRELLEIGKLGFKKALSQFNLEKDIDFSEFARSQIYQHLVNFLQSQNLDSRNEPQNEREIDITPTATRKQETLEILQDYRMNPTTELRDRKSVV